MIRNCTLGAFALACVWLAPVSASAQTNDLRPFCADRPGKGAASCVLDQGHVQIEVGAFDGARQQDAATEVDSWSAGSITARFGVGPATEFQIGVTAFERETTTDRVTGVEDVLDGTGDLFLAVRQGLILPDGEGFSVALGEPLPLLSALLYAGHIVALGRWSTPGAALGLSTVQAGVITLVAAVVAVPDGLTLPSDGGQWASLLYMALAAGALALWAQTWAQAHLTATRAAIVMALEPVFAAFFAVTLGGESLTRRMLMGGALVVAAMYLVELRSTPRDPGVSAADQPPVEALHHDV